MPLASGARPGTYGEKLAIKGIVVLFLFIAALPATARAKQDPPGPDGLPATDPKHPWKIFSGTPRVDTLLFAPQDIVPVACRQFQNDRWQVFILDVARGRIVTRWKPIHHPLLFLFMGHVNARCTVMLQPLGPNRTRIVFQGDLASHRDLRGNPMLGAAKSAYAKAAHNYVTEVRDYLNSHRAPPARAPAR